MAARGHPELLAEAQVRPQPLLERVRVVGDQRVRDAQDALGGAVVLLELDHLEVRPVGLERGEVLGPGAAPRVDRLVVVADGRERAEAIDELAHERVLRGVGVLVLVDEQVADLAAPARADLGVGLEQLHGQADEVVEVDRVARAQQLVVARVEQRDRALPIVGGGVERGLRGHEVVLPRRDHALRVARLDDRLRFVGDLPERRHRVGLVEDREPAAQAHGIPVAVQHRHAEPVERRDRQAARGALAQELLDPLAHLGGGLVRERDRDDRVGRVPLVLDQVRDLLRYDSGLARTGAREHQQGGLMVGDGGELLGVQAHRRKSSGGVRGRRGPTGKGAWARRPALGDRPLKVVSR